MRNQNIIYRGQVLEWNAGLLTTREHERDCSRIDRIGQNIDPVHLNEKGRVIDESDVQCHACSDCTDSSAARQGDLAFEGLRDFIDIVGGELKPPSVCHSRMFLSGI